MKTFNVELPETFTVTAQKGEASVDFVTAKLTDEIVGKLILHGLKQKIADAAASAKKASEADDETRSVVEIAEDLMAKVVTNLERGEWGTERTGATGDPLDPYRARVVRKALGTNPKLKKQYDAIPSTEQKARTDFLMQIAAEKADIVDPAAERMRELDLAAKKAASVEF